MKGLIFLEGLSWEGKEIIIQADGITIELLLRRTLVHLQIIEQNET